jgi:glycosyltransferase involved in cell wall biosynthesis
MTFAMNDHPLISIVLPTYNGSRYLAGSLRSIQQQSYQNWELLLQDDCSTDDTPKIIAEFAAKDPRIRPERNTVNLRLPNSLNAGFARASGRYLTWTSDDNEYRPEALERLLKHSVQSNRSCLVYSDMQDIDESGKLLGRWSAPEPDNIGWVNPVGACFLYPREVALKTGKYDDRWRLVEDWDYWLRVATHHPLYVLHDDLYLYRRHPGSLTATRAQEIERIQIDLLATRLPELRSLGRKALAKSYLTLSRKAAAIGDVSRGQEFAIQARKLDWLGSSIVLFSRQVLGAKRAGLLRNWFRKRGFA